VLPADALFLFPRDADASGGAAGPS
jgi:hypothetical protein